MKKLQCRFSPLAGHRTIDPLCIVEIAASEIILKEMDVIGEGAQGCVFKALWKQKPIAVKMISVFSNASKREVCQ